MSQPLVGTGGVAHDVNSCVPFYYTFMKPMHYVNINHHLHALPHTSIHPHTNRHTSTHKHKHTLLKTFKGRSFTLVFTIDKTQFLCRKYQILLVVANVLMS